MEAQRLNSGIEYLFEGNIWQKSVDTKETFELGCGSKDGFLLLIELLLVVILICYLSGAAS